MKKIPQLLEDKLLDYLDGKLTPVERADFEQQLRTNTALQSRLEDIRAMENSMHLLTPEQPSKNFTQVVMGKLEHFPSKASHSMRNGILLLAGILTAAGIGAILLSAGVFDSSQSAIDLNEIGLQSKYLKKSLPAIPFNGKVVVNVIIFLNVALALIVLDRTILKPLFQRRMEATP